MLATTMKCVIEILIVVELFLTIEVDAIEESFCVGLGYSDGNSKNQGLRSMGWEPIYRHPLSTIWAANHADKSFWKHDAITIKVEGVKYGSNYINGWLFLKIKTKDPILALAVWALTDTRESIGEFVSPDQITCSNNKGKWLGNINYVPCSAAPINEPSNPNMFVVMDPTASKKYKEINTLWRTSVTYCNMPTKFRFMVAYNTPKWKSHTAVVSINTEKSSGFGPVVGSTGWITPKFFGAATPLPITDFMKSANTRKEASCPDMYTVTPPWVKSIDSSTLRFGTLVQLDDNIWLDERWQKNKTENSAVASKRGTCKAEPTNNPIDFGGRCSEKVSDGKRTYSSQDTVHQCLLSTDNFEGADFQGKYEDYVAKRDKHHKDLCECPPVPTVDEVKKANNAQLHKNSASGRALQALFEDGDVDDDDKDEDSDLFTPRRRGAKGRSHEGIEADTNPYAGVTTQCDIGINVTEKERNELGLCTQSSTGVQVYGVRQWHAVSTMFCVVVLNPVSSYMARYLKGTFTISSKSPFVPIRAWYIVHIALILPMICMYTTGMAAITRQRPVLGYSLKKYAFIHRSLGWALLFVATFQVFTGFLRPRGILMRKVAIGVHWLGGAFVNYGSFILCILTYRIPASPTSFLSHVSNKKEFANMFNHMTSVILVAWFIVHLAYHAFITLHVRKFDTSLQIRRSYLPIIIPIMINRRLFKFKEEFEKEESFHQVAFTMYLVVSCVFFLLACISIYNFNKEQKHGFGPMYCTHNRYNEFLELHNGKSRC